MFDKPTSTFLVYSVDEVFELRKCLMTHLANLNLSSNVIEKVRRDGWRTLEWQFLKDKLARVVAQCLKNIYDCNVWYADLHGGEYDVGYGDKDIDIIVDACKNVSAEYLENILEKILSDILKAMLYSDPYETLGVPNIIEVHDAQQPIYQKILKGLYYRAKKLA